MVLDLDVSWLDGRHSDSVLTSGTSLLLVAASRGSWLPIVDQKHATNDFIGLAKIIR